MKNIAIVAALLLVLGTGAAVGQPFTGDFYAAGMWYSAADTVARIDRTTLKISTFVASFTTVTSRNYHVEFMHAEDNNDFYLFSYSLKSVYKIDPTGFVLKTVFDGTGVFGTPYDMLLDQNGDIILVDYSNGFYKLNPVSGVLTTMLTRTQFGQSPRAATVDIDSGDLLIAAGDSYIHRYDWISGTTTIVSGKAPSSFRYQIEQDHATGLIYTGTCCSTATGGNGMFVMDLQLKTSSVLVGATNPPLRAWYAHRFDRRVNTPGNNMIYASVNGFAIANNFSALVSLTQQGVITSLKTYGQPATGVLTAYGMEIGGSRNLCSLRTAAPNNRDILVSFPNLSRNAYVAALSLTGVRPGVPLGDGRQINLTPDDLTVLSLNNQLPGFWNPGPGTLDPFGRATLSLNLNLLGSAVKGVPVWVVVGVLDPLAPKGFAAISETHVMRLE